MNVKNVRNNGMDATYQFATKPLNPPAQNWVYPDYQFKSKFTHFSTDINEYALKFGKKFIHPVNDSVSLKPISPVLDESAKNYKLAYPSAVGEWKSYSH